MKEKIQICRQNQNSTLSVITEKNLVVELNESDMELYTKYQGKSYKVQGNVYTQYIVIGE